MVGGRGVLAVEIAASRGELVAEILARFLTDVRVEPDLTHRDRVALARRP